LEELCPEDIKPEDIPTEGHLNDYTGKPYDEPRAHRIDELEDIV